MAPVILGSGLDVNPRKHRPSPPGGWGQRAELDGAGSGEVLLQKSGKTVGGGGGRRKGGLPSGEQGGP